MAEAKLTAVIEAEDKASATLAKVGNNVSGLSNKVKDLGPVFKGMAVAGTVAFGAISALAITSFKAYADAQAQTVVTNKSLENSFNQISGKALKELKKELGDGKDALGALKLSAENAGKAALKLGFDDETAARSFAKLFSATKSVTQANKELTIAQDLARFKNISLEEATQKLVMVHAGATKELKALGLAVDKDNTVMQNMDSIMKQVSGTADEFSKTAEGAMQVMKVNADNLKESIGGALAPAFDKLKEKLIPLVQKFVDWAEKHPDLIAKIIMIGGAVAAAAAIFGTLGVILPSIIAFFTLLSAPVLLVIGVIAALIFAVTQVVRIFEMLRTDGTLIWDGIKIMINERIEAVKATIMKGVEFIKKIWTAAWTGIKDTFTSIWDSIANIAKAAIEKIKKFLQPILDMVEKTISRLNQIGAGIKGAASKAGDFLIDKVGGGINKALGINDGIVQNGKIITTHPDDFIMAAKDPSKLGGGGKDINIFISGAILTQDAAKVIGDMMVEQLRMQYKF